MANNILTLSHINKSYQGSEVLHDFSLSIKSGEVTAVIGPSGSGKSTLLRCATLLEKINGGTIQYGDLVAVTDDQSGMATYAPASVLKTIRSKFGLVFQNFNLFPHYSIIKNIMDAPICVQHRNKEEVEAEAIQLIEKMGLQGKENTYPCFLSGGQQQRVSIARALAMHPEILFFDEPTSALDPELTGEILKVIRELAKEKMTMVIVTHEIEFARNVADRVIFMSDGSIIEDGKPEDVIDHPSQERTRLFLNKLADKG